MRTSYEPLRLVVEARPGVRGRKKLDGRPRRAGKTRGALGEKVCLVRVVAAEQLVAPSPERTTFTDEAASSETRNVGSADESANGSSNTSASSVSSVAGSGRIRTVWCWVPYRSATRCASELSSNERSSNATVNVCTASGDSAAASAASMPESIPPERSTPTGTSETRCARTEPRSRSRSSSASSVVVPLRSSDSGAGRASANRSMLTLPSSHARRCPGGSFRHSRKIVSGPGTTLNARNASSASRSTSPRGSARSSEANARPSASAR